MTVNVLSLKSNTLWEVQVGGGRKEVPGEVGTVSRTSYADIATNSLRNILGKYYFLLWLTVIKADIERFFQSLSLQFSFSIHFDFKRNGGFEFLEYLYDSTPKMYFGSIYLFTYLQTKDKMDLLCCL